MMQTMKDIVAVLNEVKGRCNGMLPLEVYLRLYEKARCCAKGDIVEVGTAHAAATISIALGLRASESFEGKFYTFDRMEGGSREDFGGVSENTAITKDNLAFFGVSDWVSLVVGDIAQTHEAVPPSSKIAMLVVDADGYVDRDFSLFFDRVIDDGLIVIDDYGKDFWSIINMRGKGRYFITQKHHLTYLLVTLFVEQGYITQNFEQLGQTVFSRKVPHQKYQIEPKKILNIYRQLTLAEIIPRYSSNLSIIIMLRIIFYKIAKLCIPKRYIPIIKRYIYKPKISSSSPPPSKYNLYKKQAAFIGKVNFK